MRLKHVIRKEFIQFSKDKRMIPIVFIAPVIQLLVLGHAANLDVVNLDLAVCDEDTSSSSRALVRSLTSSRYFIETHRVTRCPDDARFFESAEAAIAVHIPRNLQSELDAGRTGSVLFTIDGSNTVPAGQGATMTLLAVERFNRQRIEEAGLAHLMDLRPGVDLRSRIWFNPDLETKNFFVPGILGLLLMLITMILTSMAVVKEKERGTIESIIVSPLSPLTLVMGKLVPFVIIGLIDVALVVAVARFHFHIPLHGSLVTLFIVSLLFILNTTGLGLLVSTISSTQQEAMMTAMFFIMMPIMYIAGFVFPIESMPEAVQWATYTIPLRHFLVAIRAIFLKGSTFMDLWRECAWLAGTGL
ncbi:MAG: ABC transporter permease, partial [Deltaproteobacteria bacterium]|nr:ABC transporter permease [Deltaproteobacteria bacterium]